MPPMKFNTIEEIIEDVRQGKMVIMTDDEARENEGDLVMAAGAVTPEKINFMSKFGRGLICTPMTEERARDFLSAQFAHSLHEMATPTA